MPITDEQFEAVTAVVDLDPYVWYDQATSFSCGEADAIAGLLHAFDRAGVADEFLASHATGDDEGDCHRPVFDKDGVVTGWVHNDHAEDGAETAEAGS
jgi:hypothetical protein